MNRPQDHRAPILFLIITLATAALGLALQATAAASAKADTFALSRDEPATIARPLTATTTYSITDLGANVYPQGVNDAGQVAGYLLDGGVTSGFLWEEGALTSLPTLDGSTTYAYDINEDGDVAVLHERHASSASTNLDNAHGLSVFFPSNSSSFYNPGNYDFAVGATWSGSPSLTRPAQEGWAGMIATYVELLHSDAPDEDAPPEPVPKLLPSWDLYLPSVNRPQT